jgi:hypothetical protein
VWIKDYAGPVWTKMHNSCNCGLPLMSLVCWIVAEMEHMDRWTQSPLLAVVLWTLYTLIDWLILFLFHRSYRCGNCHHKFKQFVINRYNYYIQHSYDYYIHYNSDNKIHVIMEHKFKTFPYLSNICNGRVQSANLSS